MNERSADEFDTWLNRELCDVRAPEGLRARLERIADGDDATLDRELRNVSIPPGLVLRLQAIPTRVVVRRWQRLPSPVRLALAASLLLFFGAAWMMAAMLSTAELYGRTIAGHDGNEPELIAQMSDVVNVSTQSDELDALTRFTAPVFVVQAAKLRASVAEPKSPFEPRPSKNVAVAYRREPQVNPMLFRQAMLDDPLASRLTAKQPRTSNPLPAVLGQSPLPFGPGVDLPLNQSDAGFLARAGVFPPVTAVGRAETSLGVNFGVGSYDVVRDFLRMGQLPPADQVRSEELIGAMSRLWVPPPVATKPKNPDQTPSVPAFKLSIQGGPSPLSGPEQRLIFVGLRARDLPPVGHRTIQLTVVVDTSAAMAVAGRLAMVQRELATLTRQLTANDRLSLVRFADSAEVVAEDLGAKDVAAWKNALASLQPGGDSEPAAGIAAGLSIARLGKPSPQVMRRVVVLTHAGSSWDDTTAGRLQPLLAAARKDGVSIDCIPVVPVEPIDSNWQRLVEAHEGRLARAVHPAQLQGQLVESFARRPQVVLPEARLKISFPAANVASYRLLGHEPSPAAVVQATLVDSHLYAGQSTCVAFEIRPTMLNVPPGTPDVELATVTVEWLNRANGERNRSSQRLMRSQIKGTIAESSPAWQTAALVASTAEVLRGSPFAEKLTLADIAQGLRYVAAPQSSRPEFQEFLTTVDRAEEVRQRLGTPRGNRNR